MSSRHSVSDTGSGMQRRGPHSDPKDDESRAATTGAAAGGSTPLILEPEIQPIVNDPDISSSPMMSGALVPAGTDDIPLPDFPRPQPSGVPPTKAAIDKAIADLTALSRAQQGPSDEENQMTPEERQQLGDALAHLNSVVSRIDKKMITLDGKPVTTTQKALALFGTILASAISVGAINSVWMLLQDVLKLRGTSRPLAAFVSALPALLRGPLTDLCGAIAKSAVGTVMFEGNATTVQLTLKSILICIAGGFAVAGGIELTLLEDHDRVDRKWIFPGFLFPLIAIEAIKPMIDLWAIRLKFGASLPSDRLKQLDTSARKAFVDHFCSWGGFLKAPTVFFAAYFIYGLYSGPFIEQGDTPGKQMALRGLALSIFNFLWLYGIQASAAIQKGVIEAAEKRKKEDKKGKGQQRAGGSHED
ncbi:hypothetical protein [Breoghania sp. JC706]|uniref:hypothetical protein n=1 Tax=Breoghania sp. JC706 TaxID=3117732 RepID=UPI003007FA72